MKSYVKPTGKYPAKKRPGDQGPGSGAYSGIPIQSKIVLLTLSFPRLRIIWSSSPFATAEIFADLKRNSAEPDPSKAISTGADDDPDPGAGVNTNAEELLRCLPAFLGLGLAMVWTNEFFGENHLPPVLVVMTCPASSAHPNAAASMPQAQ